MKTKIKSIIIATIAVVAGYVISHPMIFNICSSTYQFNNYIGCLDDSIKNIGFPILYFSLWVLLSTVAIAFFSEKTFNSWLKLAAWMVPLLLVFIAMQPVNATHILSTNRDDAARLAGGVFAAASLILIIYRALRSAHTE